MRLGSFFITIGADATISCFFSEKYEWKRDLKSFEVILDFKFNTKKTAINVT